MSAYPNSGSLGRNDRKEKEGHPDFAGQAEVDGVNYWISGWIKEGPKGKFFSLAFKKKEEAVKEGIAQANTSPQPEPDNFNDDIPF